MLANTTWIRTLFAALALTAFVGPVEAGSRSPASQNPPAATARTPATQNEVVEERPPAGSPELGVLLIIGLVGVLIFMAWLLSRAGDDSPSSDGSII